MKDSFGKKMGVALLAAFCVFYLINPTAGVFELLPDNIPFLGNVDEGLVSYVLFSCIEYFRGRRIGIFSRKSDNQDLLKKE